MFIQAGKLKFVTDWKSILVIALVLLIGCGASQQFSAVPANVDKDKVPRQTVKMTAKRFSFDPEVVRVKKGTLVVLEINAVDGTHGFQLGAFGIDERIDENTTKTVEFYTSQVGEFGFKCSHICGIGHMGMTGKIIVE